MLFPVFLPFLVFCISLLSLLDSLSNCDLEIQIGRNSRNNSEKQRGNPVKTRVRVPGNVAVARNNPRTVTTFPLNVVVVDANVRQHPA